MRQGRSGRHLLAVAVAAAVLAGCAGDDDASPAATDTGDGGSDGVAAAETAAGIDGLQEFDDLAQDHTDEDVDYPQDPPVGGPHAPVWQNCGAYAEEIAEENGVHALEHGAVWITHDVDLDEESVNALRARAAVDTHVLVSPRDGLPSPVVASAWGVQVELDGADDERLDTFIATYAQGPQTPEPGAPCDGGIGEPLP